MNRFIALALVGGGVIAASPLVRAEEVKTEIATPQPDVGARNDMAVEAKPLPQAQPEAKPPVVTPPTVQVKITAAKGFRTISPDTVKSWLLAECAKTNADGECTLDANAENGKPVDFVVNATLKAASGKLVVEMSLADRLDPKKKAAPAIREFENPKDTKSVRAYITEMVTTFVGAMKLILEDRSRPKEPAPEVPFGLVATGRNGGKKGKEIATPRGDVGARNDASTSPPLAPIVNPTTTTDQSAGADSVAALGPLPASEPPVAGVTMRAPQPVMTRPVWPWYVAGGAGVIAALTGAIAVSSQIEVSKQQDRFDRATTQRAALTAQRRGNEASGRANMFAVGAGVIGVAAATLAGLQYFGVFDREETRAVSVAPTPNGLVVAGRL